jgi:hypothetical protein
MLLVLGIVLIGYLYYSLFYTPIQNKIESTKVNIDKYVQEINNAKENKKQFETQTSELENIKAKYEEAKIVLPQMEMNPEIVLSIQKFFQGSGVEVTGITIGQPEELLDQNSQNNSKDTNSNNEKDTKDKLLTVPVTITLSADNYEEVMKFISLFENERRFAEITNIIITVNRSTVQPVTKGTSKPVAVEEQVEDNKIEVIVVGEGEEYKEIYVNGAKSEKKEEPMAAVPAIQQYEIAFEELKTKIDVNITARYYYIDTNANE